MINNSTIEGRLTKDPVLKEVGGKSVVNITLACEGPNKAVDFIPVTLWSHQATYCAKYIKQGYLVSVKGRLKTNTYEAADGSKRFDMRVVADSYNGIQMLSRPQRNNQNLDSEVNNNYQSVNYNNNSTFNNASKMDSSCNSNINNEFNNNFDFNNDFATELGDFSFN